MIYKVITTHFQTLIYKANVLLSQIKTIKIILVMKKVFVKGIALATFVAFSFANVSCDAPADKPETLDEAIENAEAVIDETEAKVDEVTEEAKAEIDEAVEGVEATAEELEAKVEEVTE